MYYFLERFGTNYLNGEIAFWFSFWFIDFLSFSKKYLNWYKLVFDLTCNWSLILAA